MHTRKFVSIGLVAVLPLSMIVSTTIGAVGVSPVEWIQIVGHHLGFSLQEGFSQQKDGVLWAIRLPRVCMSALVGASLAVGGTAMQGIFRNPLADPTIIGISAGAASVASVAIVLLSVFTTHWYGFMSLSFLSIVTFAGAAATSLLIFKLASGKRGADVATMLLAGIAINALGGAITGLMTYLATDAQLRTLTFWTLGSLGGSNWMNTGIMAALTTVGLAGLLRLSKPLNALALGENEATHIGTSVESLKRQVVVFTALIVGGSVAFCGMIGFVGLAVPHILRLSAGADHRFLLPASALGGALLLVWADTFSRTVAAPSEVPIGVITSVAGAPVFLYLLYQQKRKAA